MSENRFKIIFEKIDEIAESNTKPEDTLQSDVEALAPELEEIAELCNLAAAISSPLSTSYTST